MTAFVHYLVSPLGTAHMPKYQCTKAKQIRHNVDTNLEISFASVICVDAGDFNYILLHHWIKSVS